MLLVDYRDGSTEFTAPLKALGLPVQEVDLKIGHSAADFAFEGRGEGGSPVSIGIEFKKLGELVQSVRTNRLQGQQLPGLREQYEYCWLIIEGELLYDRRGMLQRRVGRRSLADLPGKMSVGELLKRVFVLHLQGGLNPLWTQSRKDTLKFLEMLYRVWTDEDLDGHKSHLGIYRAPMLLAPNGFKKVVTGLDDVGGKVAIAAQRQFKSLRRTFNATEVEWAELQTTDKKGKLRRVGSSKAASIVQAITKEY